MAGYNNYEGISQGINRGLRGYMDAKRFQSEERRRSQAIDSMASQDQRQNELAARQEEEASYSKSQRPVQERNAELTTDVRRAQLDVAQQGITQGETTFANKQADRKVASADKATKDQQTKIAYDEGQLRNEFAKAGNMFDLTGGTGAIEAAYNKYVNDGYQAKITNNPDGTYDISRTGKDGEVISENLTKQQLRQVVQNMATDPKSMITSMQKARKEAAKAAKDDTLALKKFSRQLDDKAISALRTRYGGKMDGMTWIPDEGNTKTALNAMAIVIEMRATNPTLLPEPAAVEAARLADLGVWPTNQQYMNDQGLRVMGVTPDGQEIVKGSPAAEQLSQADQQPTKKEFTGNFNRKENPDNSPIGFVGRGLKSYVTGGAL